MHNNNQVNAAERTNSHEQQTQPWLFWLVLALAVLVSAYQRLQFAFSAGHMDEYDYLFVAKMLWSEQSWRSYIYIFGSDLSWYLLGFGERVFGGLEGARIMAGLFALVSLSAVFRVIHLYWHSAALALLVTALLSLQAVHIFLSRFATYDIIALTFFCLTLPALLRACEQRGRMRFGWLLLAILLFVLAATSKYVTLVYLPLLAGAALLLSPVIGLLFGVGSSLLLGVYGYWHRDDLLLLYEVQIRGTHGANASHTFILNMEWMYLALPLALWLAALGWCIFRYRARAWRNRTLRCLLLLLVLALPLAGYHLYSRNMIALYKHLVYAQLFLLPAAGWLLWNVMQYFRCVLPVQLLASSLVGVMLWLNLGHLRAMERGYPDVAPVVAAISDKFTPQTTILSEDPYLFRYLAFGQVPQRQIKESNWVDNNLDGKYETIDLIDALWDSKFNYVFLNDQLHPNKNKRLRKVMAMRGYEQLVVVPYDTTNIMSRQTSGSLELYQRTRRPSIPLVEDDMFRRSAK